MRRTRGNLSIRRARRCGHRARGELVCRRRRRRSFEFILLSHLWPFDRLELKGCLCRIVSRNVSQLSHKHMSGTVFLLERFLIFALDVVLDGCAGDRRASLLLVGIEEVCIQGKTHLLRWRRKSCHSAAGSAIAELLKRSSVSIFAPTQVHKVGGMTWIDCL